MKSTQLIRTASTRSESLLGRDSPLLKRIRAIIRSGELLEEDQVLLETPRLIEDALTSGIRLRTVVVREPMSADVGELLQTLPQSVSTVRVSGAAFASLSSVETAPGAIALVDAPHWSEAQVFNQSALLLVVAGVQDPGNLGTMLRTAEAFGFSGAILTRGTVSPWNAKAFRASAGTALRLPVLRNFSPAQTVQMLHEHQVKLYGAVIREGRAPADIDTRGTIALAVGAEASGLPAELERASEHLSIPMAAKVDSLNAAAATAIILYELARQRARTGRTD